MNSQLTIKKLTLSVKLGHSVEERLYPQKVSIRIKLTFNGLLDACMNDDLASTLCYARLARAMQQFCDDRSFKLIEAFAYQLYQFIKTQLSDFLNDKITIFLCVTKNPPLSQLKHASFSIRD